MNRALILRCAELFDIHPRDLVGPYRYGFLSKPRFALYKALQLRGWGQSKIGRFISRDRTTIRYGLERAEYYMVKDAAFAAHVAELAAMPINPFMMEKLDAEYVPAPPE